MTSVRRSAVPLAVCALSVSLLAACGEAAPGSARAAAQSGVVLPQAVAEAMPGAQVESRDGVVLVRDIPASTGPAGPSAAPAGITPTTVSSARARVRKVWGGSGILDQPVLVVQPSSLDQYARLLGRQYDLPPARTEGLGLEEAGSPWTVLHPDATTTLTEKELGDVLTHELAHVALDNPVGRQETSLWREAVAEWTAQDEERAGCLDGRTILRVDEELRSEESPSVPDALLEVTGSSTMPACLVRLGSSARR